MAGLGVAYAALVDGLHAEVADWIEGWVPGVARDDAAALSAVAVDALLGRRTRGALYAGSASVIADERYIAEWTAMLAYRVESLTAQR